MNTGTINLTPSETSAFNAVWSMVSGLDKKLQTALLQKLDQECGKTTNPIVGKKHYAIEDIEGILASDATGQELRDKYLSGK